MKANLTQVSNNTTQMNAEERTQILIIRQYFEDLFDGTLGDWDTDYVNLELNPNSEPFNFKHDPLPRIKKETFCKYLQCLVKIIVLTPVQWSQYGTTVFIILVRKRNVRFITDYRMLNQKLVRNTYPLHIIGNTMQ